MSNLENTYARVVLLALNIKERAGGHIYAGTTPKKTVEKRRRRNKLARIARRNQRGH